MSSSVLTRRELLRGVAAFGVVGVLDRLLPSYAWADAGRAAPAPLAPTPAADGAIELTIDDLAFEVNGRTGSAVAINGSVPGPLVRLREGQDAVIRVLNRRATAGSIHWHGVLVPPSMDGVPGVSFAGIPPKSEFTYRFPVRQSGTYWAHAHDPSELLGLYFPLIIDPVEPEPFRYERDYVVMLSDWSFEQPGTILAKLKAEADYYNYQKRTVGDFVRDVGRRGWLATMRDRAQWAKMRMDPTDFADVTGATYTYLMNGLPAGANWTGVFRAGERVRLRFVAAGAMTYFDVRIPGLTMTLVQADGQNVRPVDIREFRIAPGETYDVVVQPEDRAYTIFAESLDRSGYARGTLAPRAGMNAPVPKRRPRPLRSMVDMGMAGMESMEGMPPTQPMANMPEPAEPPVHAMPHQAQARAMTLKGPSLPGSLPVQHGPDNHGPGNSSVPMWLRNRLDDPGSGFEDVNGKVLVYTDLHAVAPSGQPQLATREIELHLTGNMERYGWSFDGKTYAEMPTPIPFRYGERLRLFLINDTMMEHPIHLHGMWMEVENGAGVHQPLKHTISVKPAERLSVLITPAPRGRWALHCHLLLHMEVGMFRVAEVSDAPTEISADAKERS